MYGEAESYHWPAGVWLGFAALFWKFPNRATEIAAYCQ
jgi:hypothetical protein